MGKGKTGHGTGSSSSGGSTSGSSSGSSGSGSSSGSSSSGSSSSSGGSSGSSSSGSSGGSGGSGGGGQGGARSSKGKSSTSSGQANSPSNATTTSGSSSTTTGANVQTSASVSSPNYSASLGFSSNSLTQGAGSASSIHSPYGNNLDANTTDIGVKPYVYQAGQISYNPAQSFSQDSNLFYAYQGKQIDPNSAQGMQIASILAQQRARNSLLPATNADNTFQQNESASLTNAEKRQKEFVDTNLFRANPTPTPSAPIPDEIYTRTNLYQQAGQRDNPLSILEGNPFVNPQQQFLPQINSEFAPRPAYQVFQSNPYIGVHENSPIAPNSEAGETQRKGLRDWFDEIKNNKNFVPIGMAILLIGGLWFFVLKKRGGVK